MMKIQWISLLITCFCLMGPAHVNGEAASGDDSIVEDYEDDLKELESELLLNEEETKWLEDLENKEKRSLMTLIEPVVSYFFSEVKSNIHLLLLIVLMIIFRSIFQYMTHNDERYRVHQVVHFVTYLLIYSVCIHSMVEIFTYSKHVLLRMNDFMFGLIPLLISITALGGQFFSVAFFEPFIIFLLYSGSLLITHFIYPLFILSAVIYFVSQLNDAIQITHLANLLISIVKYSLIIFVTVFLTIMSVQSTITVVQDSIALKTTQFVTNNFIPIVGRTLTEGAETIVATTLLAKNSIGLTALIIITTIILFPIIKIAVIALLFRLTAALVQPLTANEQMVHIVDDIGQYIFYLLAILMTMAALYFIVILIFILSTSLPILFK